MKTKTIRINVEFPLEVPMRFDEMGRPVHPFQLVAPYIDDFVEQTQYMRNILHSEDGLACGKTGEIEEKGGCYMEKMRIVALWKLREDVQDRWNKTRKELMVILGEIFNPEREPYIQERLWQREQEMAKQHEKWMLDFDRQCHEFYGMSGKDFNALLWEDKQKIREKNNIKWNGMTWVKKPE